MNQSFMPIVEDSEEAATGKDMGGIEATESFRDGIPMPGGGISMEITGLEHSPRQSDSRDNIIHGYKPAGNSAGKNTMHRRDMMRLDDIWTEIIS
jgi:hypothetical protein